MINTENQFNDIAAVLKEYPRAAALLQEWVLDKTLKFQKMLAEQSDGDVQIPEIDEEWGKKITEHTIQVMPRILLDFFDTKNIWVVIDYDYDRIDAPEWFFRIQGETSDYFSTRTECEKEAFKKAFKILEGL